jgi:RNase P/RNase MRP subunit p30
MFVLSGPARVRFLSTLRREVTIAKEFGVSVVVSSGVGEELFMRLPVTWQVLGVFVWG